MDGRFRRYIDETVEMVEVEKMVDMWVVGRMEF
jgi:hypothetical protein